MLNTADFDRQINREWLLTNRLGGFASGSALGIPTRRYHGLLIAAAQPPVERWLLLAGTLDRVYCDGQAWELPAFDFGNVLHPHGYNQQAGFTYSIAGEQPWVQFVYAYEGLRLTKRICLARDSAEVFLHYRVEGPADKPFMLNVLPLTAMRDFHSLTHAFGGGFPLHDAPRGVTVSATGGSPRLHLQALEADGTAEVVFIRSSEWWYGFHYRQEAARGLDCREDLFVPGVFAAGGIGSVELLIRAAAEFCNQPVVNDAAQPDSFCMEFSEPPERSIEERLTDAASAYVVLRGRADGSRSTTILAGFPWFGDWGRDTFIALPGLLLETGRFTEARQVLETFASAQADGLIPNRFSDYGDGCDYNSVDASLWYVHAADAYCTASGDDAAWSELLGPVCERVVDAFMRGTAFNIHADTDGLLSCGDAGTQLTWMDAKFGDIVFTPRHGKPVEINALWYHALCILTERGSSGDPARVQAYQEQAAKVAEVFPTTFWNPAQECLYDVVRGSERDGAVRPNQIFAVSLPHTALEEYQRRGVLATVTEQLLTPYGLRSLSNRDRAYHGRYAGGPYERDGAYHQGTVWGWLIGGYVEAYLRVHGFTSQAKAEMRARLIALVDHLDEAGLGHVSEIFDGDSPHTPGGCIAQAWSVAELLRAWRMTNT